MQKTTRRYSEKLHLRREIMVNVIGGYDDLPGAITKVPAVCDIWATVVISMKYVDCINDGPLAAGALLTVQPDLNARQLLNDLDNHRVGRLRAEPVSSRNCRHVAKHRQTVWSLNCCLKVGIQAVWQSGKQNFYWHIVWGHVPLCKKSKSKV